MYIVRQLLQNELENADSRPLIRISGTQSGALQIPFFYGRKSAEKSDYLEAPWCASKLVDAVQCDTWILLEKTSS